MASRSYGNSGSFRSMPKPVSLEMPESRNGYSAGRRRESRPLPKFENDGYGRAPREKPRYSGYGENGYHARNGYDEGPRVYLPEPRERPAYANRAEALPGRPRRRRQSPANAPPARRRKPQKRQGFQSRPGLLALAGMNFDFNINPLYRQIAIVVIGLITIISVGIIMISNALAYNALAVYVDDDHVGYIPLAANWSSEAFHESAIIDLQTRRGVGVSVDQTVTLEPTRAAASEIIQPDAMLSQISTHHFTYRFSAVAIYVWHAHYLEYRREVLMRSMADVEEAKRQLTYRFQNANTVEYRFDPDWKLVPVEIVEDDATFSTPLEAFQILDRPVRTYIVYTVMTGDTLSVIANEFGVQLADILRINHLNVNSHIHAGQQIWVITHAPLLSVITVEETSRVDVLPREVQRIEVETLPRAQTRDIQEGRDGEHTVITRITRRGSVIIYEEEIPGEVIIESVPRIFEIGI